MQLHNSIAHLCNTCNIANKGDEVALNTLRQGAKEDEEYHLYVKIEVEKLNYKKTKGQYARVDYKVEGNRWPLKN